MASVWQSVLHQLPTGPNLCLWDDLQASEVNRLSQLRTHTNQWFSSLSASNLFSPPPYRPLFCGLPPPMLPFLTGVCLLCIIPHAKPWRNYQCYLLTLPPVLNWRQWCGRGVSPPFLSCLPLSPPNLLIHFSTLPFISFCLLPIAQTLHLFTLLFTVAICMYVCVCGGALEMSRSALVDALLVQWL